MSLKQLETYEKAFQEYLESLSQRGEVLLSQFEREAMRKGFEKGLEEGFEEGIRATILRVLQSRFGSYPESLVSLLEQVREVPTLEALSVYAVQAESLEAFLQRVQEQTPPPSA